MLQEKMRTLREELEKDKKRHERQEYIKLMHFLGFNDEKYEYEKEYGDSQQTSPEYPNWDSTENKPYKKAYLALTPEVMKEMHELAELKRSLNENINRGPNNPISGLIRIFGFMVYTIGILVGFVILIEVVSIGLAVIAGAFIQGTLLLGFAEIIKLLDQIKQNSEVLRKQE